MIGIDSSTLTKIINGSQATRKRDIIIALCLALQLSKKDADQALNLYPMAPLNPHNLRDLVIIQALYDKVSVMELNEILAAHGFPQLNILRGDRKNGERAFFVPLNSTTYEKVSMQVLPYCVGGDDSKRSLHERYRPDQYDFRSEMIIREKGKDGPYHRISWEHYGLYEIEIQEGDGWILQYSNDHLRQKYEDARPCEDTELLNEITKLKEYTDRKAEYVRSMYKDTRNYETRFDAVNDHGKLVIYGERFGFDAPELSEYFQLEVSSDGCLFTVTDVSRFLERYIGSKEWTKLYGIMSPSVLQSFSTLDEVPSRRWQAQFQTLLDSARELLDQIRKRKLFLFNARAWIEIDELMRIFHVEEAFECYHPNDLPYDIIPKKDQIMGPDGLPITVDDLYRAAELDILSLEELCTIRTRYGSLEQFLQIDALTAQKGKKHEQQV